MHSPVGLAAALALIIAALPSCGPAAGAGERSTMAVGPDDNGAGDDDPDDGCAEDGDCAGAEDDGDPSVVGACTPGGCGGADCVEAGAPPPASCDGATVDECHKKGICERQPDGRCGWTETEEVQTCLFQGLDMSAAPDVQLQSTTDSR